MHLCRKLLRSLVGWVWLQETWLVSCQHHTPMVTLTTCRTISIALRWGFKWVLLVNKYYTHQGCEYRIRTMNTKHGPRSASCSTQGEVATRSASCSTQGEVATQSASCSTQGEVATQSASCSTQGEVATRSSSYLHA